MPTACDPWPGKVNAAVILAENSLKCSRKTPAFATLSSRPDGAIAQAIALQANVYAVWNFAAALKRS
jgi:hypothetical protein